jgi:hypothetical protein
VLLLFSLVVSSLEFPAERFMVTYARETLINEWDARGTKRSEGVHSFGWVGQEEERRRKFGTVLGEYHWVVDLEM